MTAKAMSAALPTDAELVVETLSGNRDAFGQIVARYQSLVSSLAYSATGNLGQSEDLAQETFITAWKHLGHLRERHKLRSWLCGIARNRINGFLRREGREPASEAEPLENLAESHSPEPLPVESTISNEEAAILWRSLEKIPELYREPLVLFYREHQSVERVAQNLELTEDAVHQRLSRGRKLLQVEVLAFVEGALEKTSPGKNFTLGVLAALPMAAASAKAASIGTALAKGGAAAKGVMTIGSLGGIVALIGSFIISVKTQIDDTKSARERRFMLQWFALRRILFSLAWFALFFVLMRIPFFREPFHFCCLAAAFAFLMSVYGVILFAWHSRRRQQIQKEDNTFVAAEWLSPRKVTDAAENSADLKSNASLKPLKFMAFGIVLAAWVLVQQEWKQHLDHAVLLAACLVLSLLWNFRRWQANPRFQSLRSGGILGFPVVMGLMTLFLFNRQEYLVQGTSDSRFASPTEVFTFNLVVLLAYAGFTTILVWKRKELLRSMLEK